MNDHIQYDFLYDNHFAELKEAELRDRVESIKATLVEPFIGKYYSQDYVRRNVLRQSDEEIKEQDELINQEIEEGKIPDPARRWIWRWVGVVKPEPGAPAEMQFNLLQFQQNQNLMRLPKVERSK